MFYSMEVSGDTSAPPPGAALGAGSLRRDREEDGPYNKWYLQIKPREGGAFQGIKGRKHSPLATGVAALYH